MGNSKTEQVKRYRIRRKLRAKGVPEKEIARRINKSVELRLNAKLVSEHLSDDNFNGEW